MLKLEKSQYLNSIFQLNFTKYEKSYDTPKIFFFPSQLSPIVKSNLVERTRIPV